MIIIIIIIINAEISRSHQLKLFNAGHFLLSI